MGASAAATATLGSPTRQEAHERWGRGLGGTGAGRALELMRVGEVEKLYQVGETQRRLYCIPHPTCASSHCLHGGPEGRLGSPTPPSRGRRCRERRPPSPRPDGADARSARLPGSAPASGSGQGPFHTPFCRNPANPTLTAA